MTFDTCAVYHVTSLCRGDITVATSELCRALTALEGTTQESKIQRILSVLDEDHDGVISLEELTEVREGRGGEGRGGGKGKECGGRRKVEWRGRAREGKGGEDVAELALMLHSYA